MVKFLNNKKSFIKELQIKKLIKSIKRHQGRNNQGRITIGHKGGGHKRLYKQVAFKRTHQHQGVVKGFFYDPYRSANLAAIYNEKLKKSFFILAPQELSVNSYIETSETALFKTGNTLPLKSIPVGSLIHNITLEVNGKGKLIRSAGTYAQLVQKTKEKFAKIRLKSGELRLIPLFCQATLGVVSNPEHQNRNLKKAGRSRWFNKRPTVRGVAMNPVDHPHGGGEGKTSGGRPSVTPKGKITKGQPTRKKNKKNIFIIQRRK